MSLALLESHDSRLDRFDRMVTNVKTIETIFTVLPYVAGCVAFLASLYGIFFVYLPSFSRLMNKRAGSLLALASRPECLQGARLSGETLWMLWKLADVGDSILQAKLDRKEYRQLMDRCKGLRQILEDIKRSGYSNPRMKQLGGQCRETRACYRKVISRDVDIDIRAALEQAYSGGGAIWKDGLVKYHVLSGAVDFKGRCLALIGALRTEPASTKYFDGSGAYSGQLLLIEGRLYRVTRVYETDLGEDHVTLELELYNYQHGTIHYLSVSSPFAPNKLYLSDDELSGIPCDNIPDRIVVLDTGVLVVRKGEEETYGLFGEVLQKTTCLQALVWSRDRRVNAVKLVRWTRELGDRVSAFEFGDGRRSVVRERCLRSIPVSCDCSRKRAPIMVITD